MSEMTTADWEARAVAAEKRADEAWNAYHEYASEVESYKRDSETLREIKSSLAWKIVAPIRLVGWFWRVFKANFPRVIAKRASER